jgi:hypothetical protein
MSCRKLKVSIVSKRRLRWNGGMEAHGEGVEGLQVEAVMDR